jgi:hypothetical protein
MTSSSHTNDNDFLKAVFNICLTPTRRGRFSDPAPDTIVITVHQPLASIRKSIPRESFLFPFRFSMKKFERDSQYVRTRDNDNNLFRKERFFPAQSAIAESKRRCPPNRSTQHLFDENKIARVPIDGQ